MTITKALQNLDYHLDSLDERIEKVNTIIKDNDNEIVNYFDNHFNVALNQNGRLSEYDSVCKQLEKMADYLLYSENKAKKDKVHGDLHIVTKSDNTKNQEKEVVTENVRKTENDKIIQRKLYKKVKVTKEDRNTYPELQDTGRLIEKLKKCIETGIDSNGNVISEENMRKIRWYLIDIQKDEVAMKEMLKGYIRFKKLSKEGSIKDFSSFSFSNKNHVSILFENYSDLKQNSFDDTFGYMKLIIITFEELVERIKFEDYMFDIFQMKIDGLSRKEIAKSLVENHNIELSEARISQITKNVIPNMIVEEFKKDFEDWVYTFKIKGEYKKCSKCGEVKLANERNFSLNQKGKNGLHSQCKSCK